MIITLIIFVLVLSLLVFVHEAGHFFTARGFGVKAEEFGMGLPPRAIGFQKFKGKWRIVRGNREVEADEPIIYSLNWILVGGFVKIKGENGEVYPIAEGATVTESEVSAKHGRAAADSFGAKPIWQRITILAAGVTMNVLLTVVLLTLGFLIGMPTAPDNLGHGRYVRPPEVHVTEAMAGYPAVAAGVKAGDIILAVDGNALNDSTQLQKILQSRENQTVALKVLRNKTDLVLNVPVVKKDDLIGIGVGIADVGIVRYSLFWALLEALRVTWLWLTLIGAAVVGLFRQLFGGASAGVDFSGPVGIAVMTGQAAKMGWIYVLQFAAMLSLNLAIINILPLPALDGGRIVFLIVEKIRRKAVGPNIENVVHNIGFGLLMMLIAAITYRDILRYGGQILGVLKKSVGL